MNKRDLAAASIVLAAAGLIWGIGKAAAVQEGRLKITVAGEIFGEYELDENKEISIGETNVCRIEDGRVSMIWADCPDQICVKTVSITETGGRIVCLPNRVVLEIVGGSGPGEEGLDGISS